jgi:uncharacterized protein YyaL (SSP411 family)
VHWYAWCAEAFAEAKRAEKPVLISIGYSACHWCHVMERESFEDRATADLMNLLFVNIKVDREERPDVDQLYMDIALRFLGRGGWPLTVFCTPDGRPYYCGTYFPPTPNGNVPSFQQVLNGVADAYANRRGEVIDRASAILAAVAERPAPDASPEEPPGLPALLRGIEQVMASADREHGGFGGAPKFPTPPNLELLLAGLDFLQAAEAKDALEHCARTCQSMARRGLYDHLGGGFHRYCVDDHWGIPHFEKMLYDQGLLMRVYCEVARRTRANPDFLWPLRECATFLRREMTDATGGFYASQDADSEGEEGKFYVWTPDQVRTALGPRAQAFCDVYGVDDAGNFENHTTHLMERVVVQRDEFAAERETLEAIRAERIAPATDTKRVAAWNGYAISGLARAASLLADDHMLQAATAAARFVLDEMRNDSGHLMRVHDGGRPHVLAFLDDHAAMLDACLELYRAGAGDHFLRSASELATAIAERFFDPNERDLFLTPADGEKLIHRPRSDQDGATPHAAGLAALGLLRTALLSGESALRDIAQHVFRQHAPVLERAPHAFPTLLRALAFSLRDPAVVVVVGHPANDQTTALATGARREFLPEDAVILAPADGRQPVGLDPAWLAGRDIADDGRPVAYVCRGNTCSLPVTDVGALARLAGLTDSAG